MSDWDFFRRLMMVVGVAVLGVLVWRLSDALLLLFGAVLIGLLLSGGADAISERTGLPRFVSLPLVILPVIALIAGVAALFGAQISAQLTELGQRLPGAIDSFEQRFHLGDISGRILQEAQSNTSGILYQITSWAGAVLGALTNAVLLFVAAGFFAADPEPYRIGTLKLFPERLRPQIAKTMEYAAAALRQWLIGQLIAVVMIGATTAIALWWIGLPSPLALGLIAGVAEFVPLIGPFLGALPATLLALSLGWTEVLWVIGLFLLIQQVESNMITPIIQKRMVSLPPMLTLFAIVCFGLLFGPLGVLFATPLAVFLFVAVNQLWVRGLLHEPTEVPGEKEVLEKKREEAGV
jgi:predicted PurR-regulated permease PerM